MFSFILITEIVLNDFDQGRGQAKGGRGLVRLQHLVGPIEASDRSGGGL